MKRNVRSNKYWLDNLRAKHDWLFLLPAIVLTTAIFFLPALQSLVSGFFSINLALSGERAFVGVANFIRIASDERLFEALWNTVRFAAFSVPIEVVLGLGIAMLLSERFPGRGVARAFILVPWALPTAIMAMAWRWIFNDQYGVFGGLLMRAGLVETAPAWLAMPGTAMAAAVLADAWKTTPFAAVILLAGLTSIPQELYEAAALDGAGAWKRFKLITLPLLRPYLGVVLLFRLIHSFGIFDLIWVLTSGGPAGTTRTLALHVYETLFRYLDLGYGSALTVFMAVCLIPLAGVATWVGKSPVAQAK
ncbi:MAG: sugar ABC transporter permease [Elusimicrobiota bacterium]